MAEADPAISHADATALEAATPPAPRRHWGRLAAMVSLPVLLLIGGGVYWESLQGKVTTDNAYVHLDKVSVSAQVGGKIVEVRVKEDDIVKAGDLLFRIDPEPFQLQLAQADAEIAGAQASEASLAGASALSGAEISAAQEAIAYARTNLERQEALWKKGFTTKAAYDASKHAVEQARASLGQARADAAEARAKLATGAGGINPQVEAAKVQRAQAEVNLGRTEVRAPSAGRVAESDRLQLGQMMVAGLPAVTLVDTAHPWVDANFKETDLAHMCAGQRAEMRFDAYPGLVVRGHVQTIGAGTGSEFSVLPAQNATGNWVKVTQRVPVRIAFDEVAKRPMIAGLSTEVKVITSDGCK